MSKQNPQKTTVKRSGVNGSTLELNSDLNFIEKYTSTYKDKSTGQTIEEERERVFQIGSKLHPVQFEYNGRTYNFTASLILAKPKTVKGTRNESNVNISL